MSELLDLTAEQVLALAPDASGRTAARSAAKAGLWRGLGHGDAALWGECQGSALYQVRVARADLGGKCSCPSRKQPCKHVVGLLLLAAEGGAPIPLATPPDWVSSWIAERAASAARREARQRAPAAPADPEARARRAEKRRAAVEDGVDGLLFWMCDLVREGLATASQEHGVWERQAARLVDAQAPGLANRLRNMGGLPSSGDGPERLLAELGTTALLCRAFQRLEELPPALRADVRQLVGFTVERDEVIAHGDLVRDRFAVMGQRTEEDERFRSQRSWLLGESSHRAALVLQFAPGRAPFPQPLLPGSRIEAELAFWPGAFPQRALVKETTGEAALLSARLPGYERVEDMLDAAARAYARQPWLGRLPCVLRDVVPLPEPWRVVDREGRSLRIAPRDGFTILAESGGHPLDLLGEWNGRIVHPLAVHAAGGYQPLTS